MLIKNHSGFSIRRRRYFLLRLIIVLLCVCLFLQIKYNLFNSLTEKILITNTNHTNPPFTIPILDCSGDPLQQWCQNQMNLCDASLIVYNKLFAITHSVILQPKYAIGKRIGGENIQEVLHQPEQDEYFNFEQNFIKLPCDIPKLGGKLPNNHLSNVFSSVTSYKTYTDIQIVNETTIAVRRQDYVNLYHTMTDLYTVYLLCRFFQQDPKSVRILFIDAHPKGNLDLFWSQLFHSYTRLGHLKNVSSILYRQLIWSQPQPTSEIDIQRKRREAPSYFFDFREHILKQFDINYQTSPKVNCQSLKILFLVRHNYVAHPRNPSGKITRQLSNEKEILDDLKMKFSQYPNVNFSWNHFEELSIVEQLKIIVETDIFVGVHGAGLTHVLFLKSNRVLIELGGFVQTGDHFDLLASMNKINYYHCMIRNGSPTAARTIYNCIIKKLSEMCPSATTSMMSTLNTGTITSTMSTLNTGTTTVFPGNVTISMIKN